QHLHDPQCWCVLRFAVGDSRDVATLFGDGWQRRIETPEQADQQNTVAREYAARQIEDEDDYEDEDFDDDEEERTDPVREFARRPRPPVRGERHLFRPEGDSLRHTSNCWCRMEAGAGEFNWRYLRQYGNEIIFEVVRDDYPRFRGQPFTGTAPVHMYLGNGRDAVHFDHCWCRTP